MIKITDEGVGRRGEGYRQPHYVNQVQERVPINRSAVRAEKKAAAFERQEPRPSVDGGNPRNLIHRAPRRSVSVCSPRTGGRE